MAFISLLLSFLLLWWWMLLLLLLMMRRQRTGRRAKGRRMDGGRFAGHFARGNIVGQKGFSGRPEAGRGEGNLVRRRVLLVDHHNGVLVGGR